ncbi:MAG TPA: hypothetical protein PKD64_12635 [Pirellulaceae bacterium]|nr:hypothetical protein [Pirellulaceae bacterium]HMO93034.1 hypothetical protein [Pirellulaceae bacterium]HMP69664.1 hypothetical protein [Pirellulaceae bacterium]
MNTSTGQADFRVASCSNCSSDIRIPASVKPTAKIQCPICQAKFTVSELFAPPIAIVIDEEPAASEQPQPEKPATNPVSAQQKVAPSTDDSVPYIDRVLVEGKDIVIPSYEKTTARGRARAVGEEVSPPEFTEPRSPRYRKSESRRKEKFKSNPKKDALKIVLAGILALPVAQLILWWLFAHDPLSLAPRVHSFAPFLVPAKMVQREDTEVVDRVGPVAPDAPDGMRVQDKKSSSFNLR